MELDVIFFCSGAQLLEQHLKLFLAYETLFKYFSVFEKWTGSVVQRQEATALTSFQDMFTHNEITSFRNKEVKYSYIIFLAPLIWTMENNVSELHYSSFWLIFFLSHSHIISPSPASTASTVLSSPKYLDFKSKVTWINPVMHQLASTRSQGGLAIAVHWDNPLLGTSIALGIHEMCENCCKCITAKKCTFSSPESWRSAPPQKAATLGVLWRTWLLLPVPSPSPFWAS